MYKTLKISRKIKAAPDEVYRALTIPFAIELWSNTPAMMQEKPGTEFSLFDGAISGINLEFEPDKMIKQQWFFGDEHEASIVTITLYAAGASTNLEVEQTHIPEEAYENILWGWKEMYLAALKDFFEE